MKIGDVELKTGMLVVMKNGQIGTVLLGTANGDIVAGDTWFPLSSSSRHNIISIYQPLTNCRYINGLDRCSLTQEKLDSTHDYKLLWSKEDLIKAIHDKEEELRRLSGELEELRQRYTYLC